jgi:RimJ/RimL family protein N-acetyltransferase
MPLTPVTIHTPEGRDYTVRLLIPEDAARLGQYFAGLSAMTRSRFGPHPLDSATAADLCRHLNPAEVMRFVVCDQGHIVAYLILELRVSPYETVRYAAQGIMLDSARDCTFAPSVADAYQNRGIGSPAAGQVIATARQLGRRYMVLMGGTHATNARAIHFYHKLGFHHVTDFESPAGVFNHDMKLDLAAGQV